MDATITIILLIFLVISIWFCLCALYCKYCKSDNYFDHNAPNTLPLERDKVQVPQSHQNVHSSINFSNNEVKQNKTIIIIIENENNEIINKFCSFC
jgi:hypothetical protein